MQVLTWPYAYGIYGFEYIFLAIMNILIYSEKIED